MLKFLDLKMYPLIKTILNRNNIHQYLDKYILFSTLSLKIYDESLLNEITLPSDNIHNGYDRIRVKFRNYCKRYHNQWRN